MNWNFAFDLHQDRAEVPIFIQEGWYTTAKLDKEATKVGTGEYELIINDRLQYGQKDANGDGRFAVRRDKDMMLFQASPVSFYPIAIVATAQKT
ncbi:hypothetical protein FRB96_004361 [Tulasnella sp. 330]|nr:hypothetical protein FRB96_004361 [Tulasnella sp. 330]KAG8870228.1 hypothetical protein FRB97_000213 [Tulasnella sp. 331]KAG8872258.1 hypothetical protein FRB98_009737 [Tulasnella sp. 332]